MWCMRWRTDGCHNKNSSYEGDTQPIGIVRCADKGDSIVKYTLPEDNHQIFASKYFTYLPSEEELKRELNLKEFRKKE